MSASRRVLTLTTLFATVATGSFVAQERLQYPTTRKVDHVDSYHGVNVPDPYRWLEDDTSAETAAWVEAQNKVTFPYLERIPYRQQLQNERVEAEAHRRTLVSG